MTFLGRGLIFLIGLVPMLCTVGLAALRLAASRPSFGRQVLEAAADLDDVAFPQGIPVFTILARAFLVRDVADMARVKLLVARASKSKLSAQRQDLDGERERVEAKLAAKEQELRAVDEEIQRQEEALGAPKVIGHRWRFMEIHTKSLEIRAKSFKNRGFRRENQ